MLVRPSKTFHWADAPGAGYPGAVEPNEARKSNGWRNGNRPPAAFFNFLFNLAGQWIQHLDRHRYQSLANLSFTMDVTTGDEGTFLDICFVPSAGVSYDNLFVAVGIYDGTGEYASHYAYSRDGERWSNVAGAGLSGARFQGIGFGGSGKFVIVGENGSAVGRIWRSFNAVIPTATFSEATHANTETAGTILFDVVWNGSVWVAVGQPDSGNSDSNIQTAPADAATWTARFCDDAFTGTLAKVAADLDTGRVIAVGGDGEIQTSDDDGVTWVRRNTGGGHLRSIAHANGVWLTCGESNALWRSTDNGTTWSSVTVSGTPVTSAIGRTWVPDNNECLVVLGGVVGIVQKSNVYEQRVLRISHDSGLTFPLVARITREEYKVWAAASSGQRAVLVGGVTGHGVAWTSLQDLSAQY